ncbi:MAG: SpoIIE family protein phosphatase, partial [Candidatus Baltobacteraceae bacterium]
GGLSTSHSVNDICANLADLAAGRIADWCFTVLNEGGAYRVSAIAHRDREMVRYVEQFRARYPVRPGSTTDLAIRKNLSILTPSVTSEDLEAAAQDDLHLQILQKLSMHSVMTVPLGASSGTVYGAIVLISAESARGFTQEDMGVVEKVARRAADAIETAHILEEERRRSQRLRFIARASELVFESLDLQKAFARLCEFVVSEMADLAYVLRFEQDGALRTVACSHAEREKQYVVERLRGERTLKPQAEESAGRILSQHRTVLHETVSDEDVLPHMWEYLAAEVRSLGVRSAITVPLFARGETFGALVVYWCDTPRTYTQDDIPIFEDLGRRLSIAIEHAVAFERERNIAVALQQALLPADNVMPHGPDVAFDAEYRASSTDAEVGGDWYDAFTRADGAVVICVGDVTGRGLGAAGLMGKLRQSIGIAAIYEREPAQILDTVDQHLRSRRAHAIATAFIGIISPDRKRMQFSSAGHPAALLRRGKELVELTTEGLPLGLRDYAAGANGEISLEGADLLTLYTDGLIEGTRDILFGERRLHDVARSQAILYVRNPAKLLCDACLPRDAQDDTAVLTVRFGERSHWQFEADNAEAAHDARKAFIGQLQQARKMSPAALGAAELVFGELIGNVVRHAPGPIDVQLDLSAQNPVLHVIDHGMGFVRDAALPNDPLSESGRGLYIIAQLTKAIRVERIPGYGNHLSATLAL